MELNHMHNLSKISPVQKVCTFTGHRPAKIPNSDNEHSPTFQALYASIETASRQAITEGFTFFRSGGAMGIDLWCAEAVLRLKSEYTHIQLHFILPCETQANRWPECWRERYFDLLSQADEVTYLHAQYTSGCMMRRNRTLVDGADLVIAYYNGEAKGGTAYTVRYAEKSGVPVRNIFPVAKTER